MDAPSQGPNLRVDRDIGYRPSPARVTFFLMKMDAHPKYVCRAATQALTCAKFLEGTVKVVGIGHSQELQEKLRGSAVNLCLLDEEVDNNTIVNAVTDPRPDILVVPFGTPHTILDVALGCARQHRRICIVLSPTLATHIPLNIYPNLDHLIVDEAETLQHTGLDIKNGAHIGGEATQDIISRGARNVVIRQALQGAYCRDKDVFDWVPCPEIPNGKAADAGDRFVGMYVAALLSYRADVIFLATVAWNTLVQDETPAQVILPGLERDF